MWDKLRKDTCISSGYLHIKETALSQLTFTWWIDMNFYTGIDVWAKWWIVTINDNLEIVRMDNVPKTWWDVDWDKLKHILSLISRPVAIEDVHSIYWMSAKSNFNFWYIKWFKMACLTWKDVTLVQPKTWQKVARINDDIVYEKLEPRKVKDTKATSLNASKRIFGDVKWRISPQRTPQDWLYDSALIAYRLMKNKTKNVNI